MSLLGPKILIPKQDSLCVHPTAAGLVLAVLVAGLLSILINLFLTGFVIYGAARLVLGRRVSLGRSILIGLVGIVVGTAVAVAIPFLGWLLALILWLFLIKEGFETTWISSLMIAILAVVMAVVVYIVVFTIAGILVGITAGAFTPIGHRHALFPFFR